MKTSVIEVRDMLSVLSVPGVEERIGEVPGVESVTVNYAAGSATVRYDETRLAAADIKVAVHQSGNGSAGDSTPVAAVPRAAPTAPAAAVAPAPAAVGGHTGHPAPDAKPPTPSAAAPKAAPPVPATPATTKRDTSAAEATSAAKSPAPAAGEQKGDSWKVRAFSLATTLGVAYISCAIFDLVFPPFGLLAALAPALPFPISGSPLAFLTGFALLTVVGFALGALHGFASEFWSKRLR